MQNDWILDVLSDLKAFARTNGLTHLAGHLDDTILVAAVELASIKEGPRVDGGNDTAKAGVYTRRSRTGLRA